MKVLVNATPLALWHDIIMEAEGIAGTPLQADLESYLVFLLIRYMEKPEIVKQIMASHFLESVKQTQKNRDRLLQSVGDICLLFSGLFPGLAEKRLVKISYFINLGRSAYSTVSKSESDIYNKLNNQFVAMMDVLQSTRQYSKQYPDLLPLQAYDLWNETGSQRALKLLNSYSHAIPLSVHPTRIIKLK